MNIKKPKIPEIIWKMYKNIHCRIIFFWLAGIAGLWTALIFKRERAKPTSAIVAQILQEEQEVYFDDKTPVFAESQETEVKDVAEAVKAVKKISGLVNINTADIDDFSAIPGIGPATAQKIIDYRKGNGNFCKVEDIKKVSGIGEKKFEAMKDFLML